MNWYSLRVEPRAMAPQPMHDDATPQFAIQRILKRRLGLDAFVPAEVRMHIKQPPALRRSKFGYPRCHTERKLVALLPGFAFIKLGENVNWMRLLSVSTVVRGAFGMGEPYQFGENDMKRLFAISSGLQSPDYYRPKPRTFAAGDRVKVNGGMWVPPEPVKLVGFDSDTQRARFEMLLFGTTRVVETDAVNLEAAE